MVIIMVSIMQVGTSTAFQLQFANQSDIDTIINPFSFHPDNPGTYLNIVNAGLPRRSLGNPYKALVAPIPNYYTVKPRSYITFQHDLITYFPDLDRFILSFPHFILFWSFVLVSVSDSPLLFHGSTLFLVG